ncbi:mediator of DNA damage checkpoint protein 1-like isoform X3 [Actinia tenebrosa]|uniref:Mediator of DNA damage checkpoint protein 1 n=1 Tax=Actinia tenebrosa TaxID=6105 RepID=A0A6P8I115_ACTTE|nr:mediator of DNA damage checkpoint protein 1-like isoform X3 [Actinia tenebrosa]
MDLDDTQALDLDEYDETEEEQEVKRNRKQVGQLKVFRTGDFEEKIYDIFEGENFIGRDERTDVYIPRKSLSKTHACIEVSEGLHLVYDDNSKNRTRRDKMILKPQVRYELHHGDMLTLADTKCQYFKGKMEQDNEDNDTGSETGSESMLPVGSAIHVSKGTSKEKDVFAADTDSETDDEKNPVNIKKPAMYSSDEKLPQIDAIENSEQPKPIVPAFMYDSSDDDDHGDDKHCTKSSNDIKTHADVSADSETLAFGLISPDDLPIIRPNSKKVPEVENTPLTLVYSPDTQDRTPDHPSILPKGKEEGSSCPPTLIYGSESPYQEKNPVKEKEGSSQPEYSNKRDFVKMSTDEPDTPDKMHVKTEIASCAETLPVQEIESLEETPVRDVEPTMLHGAGSLEETPLKDMPKLGETPSEFNVYLPETQGFSPGNEETSFCEPTQAYLQESPVDTPKETPGEMVSDVTSIPDSQEEEGEEEEVKKTLSYDDDTATQAYTWDNSDATDDGDDDELRFQATQAYPSLIQQPKKDDDDDDIQQGADVKDSSPCASSSPHADMQQTIAYDVAEMETQVYVTERENVSVDHTKGKGKHPEDKPVEIEPTLPYNIMDMETQAYEAETEETTSPASNSLNKSSTDDEDKGTPEELKMSAVVVGDRRGVTIEPTLPYDLETETQDFDNNEKDAQETSRQTSKKNAEDDNLVIEATVPYDMEMETQAYDRKDIDDSETDDECNLEKKEGNMADMMETQAYGDEVPVEARENAINTFNMADMMETQAYGVEVEALENAINTGASDVNDADGEPQAYGLEDQATVTDDVIPDSEDLLSQEIPLKRISEDEDTVNNNASVKTPTIQHDKQQVEQSGNKEEEKEEEKEEAEIIVRPKRRGKSRVTHSSPEEENQQPAMLNKLEDTTTAKTAEDISLNEQATAPEDVGVQRSKRGKRSKKNKVETEIQDTLGDASEEEQFKIATKQEKSTRERKSTRGKTCKISKTDDTEIEQSTSMSEKRPTRGRRSKKSEVEIRVQGILPDDTEEEQSMLEKRPTRGRQLKKSEVEPSRVEDVLPDNTEEERQESPSTTKKRPTRGRPKKTVVKTAMIEDSLPEDTEKDEMSLQPVQTTHNEHLPEKKSLRGRRSMKTGKELDIEEKIKPVDNAEDKNKSESVPQKRVQQKMSTRGTKKDEEDRLEGTGSGDNKEKLDTCAENLDISPGHSEEEQFAVKHKGKGKDKKSLQVDQDSSCKDEEELPSLEIIFSDKKVTKGKRKGKTKDAETPVLLSGKDTSTAEAVRNEGMSFETIEVKPFFPRRGRGRVTQSDDSASAVPGSFGSELSEFKEEDFMSPQSVAKSISALKKEKKKKGEEQNLKETEMDINATQSNSSSPRGSKTRKRGKEVRTDLDESQSSVTSSVGREARGKGKGKKAKSTKVDDTHVHSASQASSDLSESQNSTASSGESRARGKGRRRTGKPSTLDDSQEQEVQETPVKKGRTVKQEDSPTVVHSPSLRERKPITPKIMFTGVSDKQAEKIVTSLGGILVDSVYECTHLITDKVRRTVKFLCGVASAQMIVQPQWLTACKKAKCFIEPVPFIVSDEAAEKQYSFSLQQSLERAKKGGLLEGYKVHITKNVKPDPSQMKDIIKSAKGEYLPRMPRTMENNILVVSSEEDRDLCKAALDCSIPVYSSELLLTGVLRQELDLDQNRLFTGEKEDRKRKESEDEETSVKSASRKRRKR